MVKPPNRRAVGTMYMSKLAKDGSYDLVELDLFVRSIERFFSIEVYTTRGLTKAPTRIERQVLTDTLVGFLSHVNRHGRPVHNDEQDGPEEHDGLGEDEEDMPDVDIGEP